MRNKVFCLLFAWLLFASCDGHISINAMTDTEVDSALIGKYKTEYVVYYEPGTCESTTIYTTNETYTCSYQGTNFLLEKDNSEELFSSTAPVRIKSCKKVE